ncbi:hypothetical protein VAA96_004547 [Salmonella enterica]|nr:hypothetical protein [Salmonella enterica]
MINYPVYPTKPEVNPEEIERYGVGYPFIHSVYDVVKVYDKTIGGIKIKRDKNENPVFNFTYHYQKKPRIERG